MSQAIDVVYTTSGSRDSVDQRLTYGDEVYDSDCDDVLNTQPSFMANISSYGSDALAEVHNPDNVGNNMINQGVQVKPSSEQSIVVNHSETEINRDSNIIPYSQYVTESQQTVVQNSNSYAQQDTLILSVIEQLKSQSVEIDRLKQTLSEQLKKESLMQAVTLLKNDFNTNCSYVDETSVFYDHITKQALGFQNPFYIKKAQQLEPKLYDSNVIKNTSAIVIPDSEETLILAEESHPSPSCTPTKVEVPIELPKVIMTYKQLNDSIKPTRIRSKEHFDALIAQINAKSVENSYLNAQLQEKPKVIAPVVNKVDLEPLSPKLKNNREAHVDCIRITKENADSLRDIVEQARTSNPLDNALAYACMYKKQIQELLVYVSNTCPSSPLKSEKLVSVTPMNNARKVTFAKTSTTSDNNTQIQVDVHQTRTTNKPLVPSTNEKCSTNASRSKPQNETNNNKIMQPLISNQKYQKVEAHSRNVKPSLTKKDSVSKSVCLTCNKCYFDASHDLCVLKYLSKLNDRVIAKAVKSIKMKEWKPIGKMFKNVGYKWVSTGRTFTIVGTKCPLTRFTSIKIVSPRKPVKSTVKEKQEKDKIGSKPDKNGKRGKSRQCRRPITVEKEEKKKKIQAQGTKDANPRKLYTLKKKRMVGFAIHSKYKYKGLFCQLCKVVKEKQEKDKIGSKPDKNGKRGKARQCRRPITVEKEEKKKKIQAQGTKDANPRKLYTLKKKRRAGFAIHSKYKYKGLFCQVCKVVRVKDH
nr:hypothetical protein [Tanacetum cinerariifolium]